MGAKGRGGAGLIGAQMGCQLPLMYVHAVNFMVKFSNVIAALTQGYILSMHIFHKGTVADAPKQVTGSITNADKTISAVDWTIDKHSGSKPTWWIKHTWWLISSL